MISDHLIAPTFSGIDTFWRAPFVLPDQVSPDFFAVVGMPSDSTISTRAGTRWGPKAIRAHSVHFVAQTRATPAKQYVAISTGKKTTIPDDLKLVDVGDALIFPNDMTRTTDSITSTIQKITERRAYPVSLGGDHYIAFPIMKGFCEGMHAGRGFEKFGYIQIDAHLDAAGENYIWGTHWHGSNARLIADLPRVDKRNMAWLGINGSTWTDEWEFANSGGACLITRPEIAEIGIAKAAQRALEAAADGVDAVYLSVCLDVVDVSLSPGVGSVNFGGISPTELLGAVELLARSDVILGIDVVELCPSLDPSGITGRLAAAVLMTFLEPRLFIQGQ